MMAMAQPKAGGAVEALLKECGGVPWKSAFQVTKEDAGSPANNQLAHKSRMQLHLNALMPQHFLVWHEGKVQLVHGLRICHPLDNAGKHAAALKG
jgi:hypothetical protein